MLSNKNQNDDSQPPKLSGLETNEALQLKVDESENSETNKFENGKIKFTENVETVTETGRAANSINMEVTDFMDQSQQIVEYNEKNKLWETTADNSEFMANSEINNGSTIHGNSSSISKSKNDQSDNHINVIKQVTDLKSLEKSENFLVEPETDSNNSSINRGQITVEQNAGIL